MDTAISRKVVGKSALDNPERYCGWFWAHCFPKKFQRMAQEAIDVCLPVLNESNKSRFDSYSVRKSALIMSHITFRDCRVHSLSDNLPRNSCLQGVFPKRDLFFVVVFFCFCLLIITLNNYIYKTHTHTDKKTLTRDINRVKQKKTVKLLQEVLQG